MTWPKALPVVIIAFLFDIARAFFGLFWLFGPALGAGLCVAGVDYATGIEVTGTVGKAVAATCSGLAAVSGIYFSTALVAFGTMMAMSIGLMGWLIVWMWLLLHNPRIFKENLEDVTHVIWFYLCLFVIQIPIIGCAPFVGAVTYRMHKYQIKTERKALAEYEQEQATQNAYLQQERDARVHEILALRAREQEEAEEEEIPEYEYEEAA